MCAATLGFFTVANIGSRLPRLTNPTAVVALASLYLRCRCPPWSGMMLVLGLLGVITSLLHAPGDDRYSLKGALTRVEVTQTQQISPQDLNETTTQDFGVRSKSLEVNPAELAEHLEWNS
eukprot:168209-Amphidinium_carterae.1